MDSGLWRVPVPQPRTLSADEYDPAIYRTELTGYDDGSWKLRVDADLVAETDGPLDQDAAQDWARQQMGEGVAFLNGTFFEPSQYWVANPDTRPRRSSAESMPAWRPAAARNDRSS